MQETDSLRTALKNYSKPSYRYPKTEALIIKLKETFPKAQIELLDNEMIYERLSNNPKCHQLKNNNGIICGFVTNGNVYLNKYKLNANTIIHEYGHIFQHTIPIRFNNGIDLLNKSIGGQKLIARTKTNSGYANYSQEEIQAEALVTAMGDKGESVFTNVPNTLAKFKEWVNDFFKRLGNKLGIVKLSPDYKFDKFVRDAVGDILMGNEIVQDANAKIDNTNTEFQYEPSELDSLVKELREIGDTDAEIKSLLLELDNTEASIDEALGNNSQATEPTQTNTTTQEPIIEDKLTHSEIKSESKSSFKKAIKYSKYFLLALFIVLLLTNPTVKDFKEYLGGSHGQVRRKNNFILFSIYQVSGDKYVGILKNFIEISR